MANAKTTKTSKTAGKAKKPAKAKKLKFEDLPAQSDPKADLKGADLLSAAQPVLAMLEKDLLARAKESAGVTRALKQRYAEEKKAERTADSFVQWQGRIVTQVAASWLLSCVFVRTLEDRGLLGQARIAGPGAMDSQKLFFELSPSLTERDYLLTVFRELSRFPAAKDLFDAQHSLLWKLSPSANAAKLLLALFRSPNADTPAFRFGQASTRVLGDLYQDLSEDVRKRYALLQTPDFVESFILDRTLEPAIERFGLDDTTIIDPTCGSGHFLLGSFDRLFEHRQRHEPGIDARQAAHKALDQVFGADINPYAVAIARFRLTLSYLEKAGFSKIVDAPELPLHLVVADSLLHNPHQKQLDFEHQEDASAAQWRSSDVFALEDEAAAKDVLHRQYAAVVGNPPYITVKDKALRDQYRAIYSRSAFREYSLAAPFCERFFQLGRDRGYIGQITANSFMKREFGKKLIQDYLPSVNLELIVNASGAYIPGHGTPTVLLFGTHEKPQERHVLSVLAKRGEPSTPTDPAKGEVWSSIAEHWKEIEFENDYISIANTNREKLATHPWSLAGGGATELKTLVEERAKRRLIDMVDALGFMCMTRADDIYFAPRDALLRAGVKPQYIIENVEGEVVRDWVISQPKTTLFPYESDEELSVTEDEGVKRFLWPYRSLLWTRREPNGNHREIGLSWWEWSRFQRARFKRPLSITFAEVASHNHFVFDQGGKAFKQTAPIIKLAKEATEDEHFALLAYLNSSAACFWLKQVCFEKYSANQKHNPDPIRRKYQFAGTAVGGLPVPEVLPHILAELGRELSMLGREQAELLQGRFTAEGLEEAELSDAVAQVFVGVERRRARMLVLQEEIDWVVYEILGFQEAGGATDLAKSVAEDSMILVSPGGRPFEIERGYHQGHSERVGVEREFVDQSVVPAHWVERMALQLSKELSLLEKGEFKRVWRLSEMNTHPDAVKKAIAVHWFENWLLETCETQIKGNQLEVVSARSLDSELRLRGGEAIARYLNEELGDWTQLLICDAAAPAFATERLSESGLKKHKVWREVWTAQRAEDAGSIASLILPPTYAQKDMRSTSIWRNRGPMDVPKERFISYPGCESDQDGEPVYGWAGWDHLQRAQALASLYQNRKTEEGWDKARLTPMLAGLLELIPWVKQWHNEPNDEFGGLRMGDYFADFLDGECRELGLSHQDLEDWRPSKATRGGKKKAVKKPKDTEAGRDE